MAQRKKTKQIYCPTCKKYFHSLGYARHRAMHYEEKKTTGYVHNGHCRRIRHKCSLCGRVRLERFMKPLNDVTRYGNRCWTCTDINDDEHNKLFRTY